MRKLVFNLPFVFLLVFLVGCGDLSSEPNNQIEKARPIQDSWLDNTADQGQSLDGNLLRKNFYLVLDCSGSMAGDYGGMSRLDAVKTALSRFLPLVPEDTNLGLLTFERGGVAEKVPLGVGNRKLIVEAINRTVADGGTPLSTAVSEAYGKLKIQGKKQLGYGEYHMIILTDGEANLGYDPTSIVNEILSRSSVVIHTIGIAIGTGHSLNQPGKTIYKDAANPKDLEEGLAEIAAESDKF